MSTGNECIVLEARPGQWYYILEDHGAPKNAWDWREFATCYGPFPTMDAALKHLGDNHANPGGYSVQPYDPTHSPDEVERKLIESAVR